MGAAGLLLLMAAALLVDVSRGLFVADEFASRAAESLGDERVSSYVAGRITDAIVSQRPDLTAVRPLLVGATDGLVGSAPFRAVARTALRTAHSAFFSEGGEELLLSVPDVGILLQSALAGTNPELAGKIPNKLQAVIAGLPKSRAGEALVLARKIWSRVAWLQRGIFLLGLVLLTAGVLLYPDRRWALMRVGVRLVAAALVLALTVPAGRLVALALSHDAATRGAIFGVWRAFLLPIMGFAVTFGGTGLILAAAANSLYEKADPLERLRQLGRILLTPPAHGAPRVFWILGTAAAGAVLLTWPSSVVTVLAVLGGLLLAFLALREFFRMLLERVPVEAGAAGTIAGHALPIRSIAGVLATAGLIALFSFWWKPGEAPPPPADIVACNGAPELCNRRIDQVSFAATHNSMSNAQIPGWMFPHQSVAFTGQLQNGIRALLIDIHYGFPGGARIKTDLEGEGATREKLVGAVGEEGFEAAQRIRNRLVGVDEGKRGLYFCHGFCELGAYLVAPALETIRDWLVLNPGEVVLLVIEDYVTPAEIAQAFTKSGLIDLVYTGPIKPFPTLRSMIDLNGRVLVFSESGKPGVPWIHPAFESFQETPYTFHTPEEFSCKPNRGGTTAPLFQVNHWIETTPAPRPSNAAVVNTYDELLKRARTCQKERRLRPTYLAVDFGDIGDIVQVTRTLNGLDTVATRR